MYTWSLQRRLPDVRSRHWTWPDGIYEEPEYTQLVGLDTSLVLLVPHIMAIRLVHNLPVATKTEIHHKSTTNQPQIVRWN